MVNGKRQMFGFHGIWQGVAVLYDRETQSEWLHLSGECVRGKRKGEMLERISGLHTTWGVWREAHPETTVMATDPKFSSQYFPEHTAKRGNDFFPQEFPDTIQTRDPRLPLSALLYGVAHNEDAIAFPLSELKNSERRVHPATVGGMPIVLVFDPTSGTAAAFDTRIEGETLPLIESDAQLAVEGSPDRFDFSGRGVAGRWNGKQLRRVGMQAEWYGWRATYPKSRLFEAATGKK